MVYSAESGTVSNCDGGSMLHMLITQYCICDVVQVLGTRPVLNIKQRLFLCRYIKQELHAHLLQLHAGHGRVPVHKDAEGGLQREHERVLPAVLGCSILQPSKAATEWQRKQKA
jgi:hypothetical protein